MPIFIRPHGTSGAPSSPALKRQAIGNGLSEAGVLSAALPKREVAVVAFAYNNRVEKKIFWIVFIFLGLVADFVLPIWWALVATIPIAFVSWWVAYRSDWF